ncbi:response regulator [Ilumatobacter sp.]|uniref:response regulator n=1 Tax=Ilumatobacter sp. TaxID=1967498 RepID=UPI003B519781
MRVLVVDDSKAMRMIVSRTLRQTTLEISELREAEDGTDALAILSEYDADLVLCDWNMPNMNGIDLLEQLRAAGDERTFGFVTSESNPAMWDTASAAGASFLITKPFTAERFSEAVGSLVG